MKVASTGLIYYKIDPVIMLIVFILEWQCPNLDKKHLCFPTLTSQTAYMYLPKSHDRYNSL